jgi:hypothetical protein
MHFLSASDLDHNPESRDGRHLTANTSRLKADLSARVRHFGVRSIPEKSSRIEESASKMLTL